MAGPSQSQLYAYLTSRGANPNEATMLTGAATNESSLNPDAVHDQGSGLGMFGHRGDRLDNLKTYASNVGTAPNDWQTQADFALNELRSRPESAMVNAAQTPQQLAVAQMHFEQPQGYTKADPTAGANYQGRLQTISKIAGATGAMGPGANYGLLSPTPIGSQSPAMPAATTAPAAAPAAGAVGVGNPQLNASLQKLLQQAQQPGQKPLLAQLLGKVTQPVHAALSNLLGGPGGAAPAQGSPPQQMAAAQPAPGAPVAGTAPPLAPMPSAAPLAPIPAADPNAPAGAAPTPFNPAANGDFSVPAASAPQTDAPMPVPRPADPTATAAAAPAPNQGSLLASLSSLFGGGSA